MMLNRLQYVGLSKSPSWAKLSSHRYNWMFSVCLPPKLFWSFPKEQKWDREKIKIPPPAVRYVTAKTIVRKLDVLQQNKYTGWKCPKGVLTGHCRLMLHHPVQKPCRHYGPILRFLLQSERWTCTLVEKQISKTSFAFNRECMMLFWFDLNIRNY